MVARKRKGERYIDRWLREHPKVTLYLKREEYTFIKGIADTRGVSIRELVLEVLRGVKQEAEAVYKMGFEDGYKAAKEKYRVTVPCAICGQPITVLPNGNIHKHLLGKRWAHRECYEKAMKSEVKELSV